MQSESSDGEKWWNLDDSVKRDNWCVPGDFRGEFIFRLYRMGIYTKGGRIALKKRSMISDIHKNSEKPSADSGYPEKYGTIIRGESY